MKEKSDEGMMWLEDNAKESVAILTNKKNE